jgi:hypothetical protein
MFSQNLRIHEAFYLHTQNHLSAASLQLEVPLISHITQLPTESSSMLSCHFLDDKPRLSYARSDSESVA